MSQAIWGIALRWFLVVVTSLSGSGLIVLSGIEEGLVPTVVVDPGTPAIKPMDDPTVEPVDDPIDDPADDPTDEPTDDPTDDPVDDPAEELTREVTATLEVSSTLPTMIGLVFHPAHLNAGGKCRGTYSASGSLKNHGPDWASNVTLGYEVTRGNEWVDSVEIAPTGWEELGTSKPGRFTVNVYTNEEWAFSGKGSMIVVRVFVASANAETMLAPAETLFTIQGQCRAENADQAAGPDKTGKPGKPDPAEKSLKPAEPGKPDKPGRPDQPGKPDKPDKPGKPGKGG